MLCTHISLELVAVPAPTVRVGHAEPGPSAYGAALSGHSRLPCGAPVEAPDARHVPKPATTVSPAAKERTRGFTHTEWFKIMARQNCLVERFGKVVLMTC